MMSVIARQIDISQSWQSLTRKAKMAAKAKMVEQVAAKKAKMVEKAIGKLAEKAKVVGGIHCKLHIAGPPSHCKMAAATGGSQSVHQLLQNPLCRQPLSPTLRILLAMAPRHP